MTMKFLFIVFCIILFFYVLSLIGRSALNVWVRRRQREFARAGEERKSRERAKARKQEGRITIRDTRASSRRRVGENVGEYIEYEEITTEKGVGK